LTDQKAMIVRMAKSA